ncbi:hypothetical protein DKX38_018364 [Salix brachista]|uniref:Uncharacterized protein n=1 Tax=Salix brachista TaxID=2182728 RepID=A0A5N5KMT6_9ROSI|nr:hypothetical protein DKX38_018364 [Salix brachista]
MVLFVTLYQKIPTNETLPKELHPVFSVCCSSKCCFHGMEKIQGSFDHGSRLASVFRLNCFIKIYSSTMLSCFLPFCRQSVLMFFRGFKSGRLVSTIVHEVSLRDLFPDDIAITISTGNTTASSQELVPYTTRKLR